MSFNGTTINEIKSIRARYRAAIAALKSMEYNASVDKDPARYTDGLENARYWVKHFEERLAK